MISRAYLDRYMRATLSEIPPGPTFLVLANRRLIVQSRRETGQLVFNGVDNLLGPLEKFVHDPPSAVRGYLRACLRGKLAGREPLHARAADGRELEFHGQAGTTPRALAHVIFTIRVAEPTNAPNRPCSTTISREHWREIAAALHLTPREVQIAQGIFAHLKQATIARQLRLSRHTVHSYLQRIYAKLKIHSRLELFARIMNVHLGSTGGDAV